MSDVVLDSGIFIASVYPEELTLQAQQLLKQLQADEITLNAPHLLRYELVAVSRKAVHRGRVSIDEGKQARDKLLDYPVRLHFNDKLLKRAYDLATEYNRPTAYDTQYLALAESLSCSFWTADKRLFNAVNKHFSNIYWLGDQ